MKNISLLLAVILCAGLFAACSGGKAEESAETEINVDEAADYMDDAYEDVTARDEANAENSFTGKIGLISSVSEESITLMLYESESVITDYSQIDVSALTSSGSWETMILSEQVTYWYLEDGVETGAAYEDLTVDSMIAVTTDENDIQKIVILEKGENETVSENEAIFARVESVEEDYLTLNIYTDTEIETDPTDTDYASVEWDRYADTYETSEYVFAEDVTVQIAEDGILTDSDTASIAEGSGIVIYQNDEGGDVIVVYQNIE